MLWLAGILPLWVDAAKFAYDFLISILEFGDRLEQSAMSHWQFMCAQQEKDWYYDIVQFFQDIGVLHNLGGMDAVLTWGAQEAKFLIDTRIKLIVNSNNYWYMANMGSFWT